MFGNVVLGIDKDRFEHELSAVKKKQRGQGRRGPRRKAPSTRSSSATRRVVQEGDGQATFPQDPREQLTGARDAVFRSWMNPRAVTYRKLNDIPHDLGTAVNVQSMVFGNMGDTSATGVGFTRNPSTGAKEFYGEFLQNAQGEDVVAGIRTPRPIAELRAGDAGGLPPAPRDHHPPGAALQGRPGLRVHDPGEHAVHAPDPQRQAHGPGRGAHRGGPGGRGDPHAEGSGGARSSRSRSTSSCIPIFDPKARAKAAGRGQGPARVARRRHGRGRVHRRRRGGLEPARASAWCSCAWRPCPTTSTA